MVNVKHANELTEYLDEKSLMNSISDIALHSLLEPIKSKYKEGYILIVGDHYWRKMELKEQRIITSEIYQFPVEFYGLASLKTLEKFIGFVPSTIKAKEVLLAEGMKVRIEGENMVYNRHNERRGVDIYRW